MSNQNKDTISKDTIAKDNNWCSKLIKWLYSGNHPQQKYYKGLQQATADREKGIENERQKLAETERTQRQQKTE